MAISVADNFSYKGAKPLDARTKYATISDMTSVPTSDLYDGCLAYVVSEKKNYQYDSTNTVDPTTGKWRELETGGGGGTTYTAGDGIVIENDEISTDNASAEDMEEIITPLPGTFSRRFKYSTTEQVVGEWINGKPIYQKTVDCGALPNSTTKNTAHGIANLDQVVHIEGVTYSSTSGVYEPLPRAYAGNDSKAVCIVRVDSTNIILKTSANLSDYNSSYLILQYTKTTDQANS